MPTTSATPTQSNRVSGIDQRIVKSLGHPLRQRILLELNRRVASPSEIAQTLEEPLANVCYHVKVLRDNDAIELVKTAPVRGAIEHFYRAAIRPYLDDAHWAQLPLSTRRALFDETLQWIWDDVREAAGAGGLDDLKTHISRVPLHLDDQAWGELAERLEELLEFAMRLDAEAGERLTALPEDERRTRTTRLALMQFERPESAEPDGQGNGKVARKPRASKPKAKAAAR